MLWKFWLLWVGEFFVLLVFGSFWEFVWGVWEVCVFCFVGVFLCLFLLFFGSLFLFSCLCFVVFCFGVFGEFVCVCCFCVCCFVLVVFLEFFCVFFRLLCVF